MQTPFCFVSIAGSVVDDGVLRGVSVITEGEAKGHGVLIDSKTIETVKACADTHKDGVQVKIDHGTGFASIVGVLKNFRIEGPKLLADLHLLKTHEDYATIVEIAQAMPSSVGLSISFSGAREEIDGKQYARCTELYSVDFVDQPAANPSGLFSAVDSRGKGMANADTLLSRIKAVFVETENKDLETANAQVIELKTKVSTFETTLDAKDKEITELKAAQTEFAAKVADFDKKVELAASEKAKQIMAAVGQPAIPSAPAATPADVKPKSEKKGLARVEEIIALEIANKR